MSRRRKARETALQTLYASEVSGKAWEEALDDMLVRRKSSKEAEEYARRIVRHVSESKDELDEKIIGSLENWRFDRVAIIDRMILRMALAELIYCPEVPVNVIINEAIEIAHKFSSGKAGKFVNGILDKLSREIRENGTA